MAAKLISMLFVISALPAIAATTTFLSVADNTLIEDVTGSRSNGIGDAVYVGLTQRDGDRRGLLRFDLSSLPAASIVDSARLKLTLVRARPENFNLNLHQASASWGEGASASVGGVGAPARPGDATWFHRSFAANPARLWSQPGGDFAPAASASLLVPAALAEGAALMLAGNGMRAQVQAWVTSPATNHGWVLVATSDVVPGAPSASAKAFASREHPTTAYRPTLEVTWTAPAPGGGDDDIPVPAWALLLLGATLAVSLGRKR